MLRKKSKWRPHKDESTDAEHRGGLPRSSDEASVMAVERRGKHVQSYKLVNQKWEEPASNAKPALVGGHEEPDELRGSRPVLREPGGEIPLGYSTINSPNRSRSGL